MKDDIEKIINEAIWAPSGDNTQPWLFKIESDHLLVYCTPEKDNPVLNFHHSGTYISTGAVLENILIISNHYGYQASIEYFPNESDKKLVAKIGFSKISPKDDPLYFFIEKRHTNRKKYEATPLTLEEKRIILGAAKEGGPMVRLIDDKADRKMIGKECSITEEIALETEKLHRLFFDSLVWSKEEEREKGRGLHIKTLELPLPIMHLFRILKHWPVTNFLNKLNFSKLAAKGNAAIYESSPILGAIVINDHSLKNFVLVGQLLQRLWLTVTKLDLSLQPVTGTVFFFQRLKEGDMAMFLPKHVKMIVEAEKVFRSVYGLKDGEMIAIHFRIGHSAKASERSSRVLPKIL